MELTESPPIQTMEDNNNTLTKLHRQPSNADLKGSTPINESSDTHTVTGPANRKKSLFPVSPWPVFIVCCLHIIPTVINLTTTDALLYDKLCYRRFNNLSLCNNRTFTGSHPDLQKEQAAWSSYVALLQLPFAIITNLVLSSFCDKVGHKLPLVLPTVGTLLATLYLALLATPGFLGWPMATVLGFSIIVSIFGGPPLMVMASFSYIAYVTPPEKRTVNMAIAEGSLLIGALIGQTANGFIIDDFGLDTLAYITAAVCVLPMLIGLVFMTEAMTITGKTNLKDAIGVRNLLSAFQTLYKRRAGYSRMLLNTSFVLYAFPMVAYHSSMAGGFLYFVKERGLTMSEFSIFNGYVTALKGVGGPLIVLVIKKYFKPDEYDFAMACAVSSAIGYTVISIDTIPGSMWIGGAFLMFQAAFFAVVRVIQTQHCSNVEFGKLFAFDAIMQIALTQLSSTLVKQVYASSFHVWPGLFLALCAFWHICSMAVLAIVRYYSSKHYALQNATKSEVVAVQAEIFSQDDVH